MPSGPKVSASIEPKPWGYEVLVEAEGKYGTASVRRFASSFRKARRILSRETRKQVEFTSLPVDEWVKRKR